MCVAVVAAVSADLGILAVRYHSLALSWLVLFNVPRTQITTDAGIVLGALPTLDVTWREELLPFVLSLVRARAEDQGIWHIKVSRLASADSMQQDSMASKL